MLHNHFIYIARCFLICLVTESEVYSTMILELLLVVMGISMMGFGLFRLFSWTTVPVVMSIPVAYGSLIGFSALFSLGHGTVVRLLAGYPALAHVAKSWGAAGKALEVTSLNTSHVLLCAFMIVFAYNVTCMARNAAELAGYLEAKNKFEVENIIIAKKKK